MVSPLLAYFVQNNLVDRLTIPVAQHARACGIPLEDRSSTSELNPDDCGIDWGAYDIVLPYGSVQFIRHLKDSSLRRFVLHDEALFASSRWTALCEGTFALNGAGEALTVEAVSQRLAEEGARLHLRPDAIDKAFVGAVVDLAGWQAIVADRKLEPGLLCWASPVQDIEAEWRCWVIGGQVVEISRYRTNGQRDIVQESDPYVWRAASILANIYLPAPCVVLDMAQTANGTSVVEFNPIHCAGWYAADVPHILSAWEAWSRAQAWV